MKTARAPKNFRSTRRFTAVLSACLLSLSVLLWLLFGGAAVSEAQFGGLVITVNSTLDLDASVSGVNCILPIETERCTLRAAIQAANFTSGVDTIRFDIPSWDPNCSDSGQCDIDLSSALPSINSPVNITGPGASHVTVGSLDPDSRLATLTIATAGNVNISGLTITGGRDDIDPQSIGQGGGIFVIADGAVVTITRCVIAGNGVQGQFGTGGIIGGSSPAAHIYDVTLNIVDTVVRDNYGRGIRAPTVNVINSTISGNEGGIHGDSITVTNSTISENRSLNVGGIFGLNVTLKNSTVVRNAREQGFTASPGAGGVRSTNATISSSIIALNTNGDAHEPPYPDAYGAFTSEGYNIIGSTFGASIVPTPTDQFEVTESQLSLGPLQDNGGPTSTISFSCSSIAVDAGADGGLPTDQRGVGFPRVFGAAADVGAFELQEPPCTNTAPAISVSNVTRRRGDAGHTQIAAISDDEDPEESLVVTVNGGGTATLNGVTVADVSVNSTGAVTAGVSAACNASDAAFTLAVSDSSGALSTATLNVSVTASRSPVIVLTSPLTLSANGQYRSVIVDEMVESALDQCDGDLLNKVFIEKATSDEADNVRGNADGNTVNDIKIGQRCRSVELRAERNRSRNGRVYSITLAVIDSDGQTTRADFKVSVLRNPAGFPAVEDPPVFSIFGSCS